VRCGWSADRHSRGPVRRADKPLYHEVTWFWVKAFNSTIEGDGLMPMLSRMISIRTINKILVLRTDLAIMRYEKTLPHVADFFRHLRGWERGILFSVFKGAFV
jgi:hypothetical protein